MTERVEEVSAEQAQAESFRRLARKARVEGQSETAAGVARELQSPLFGISSAAQLLRFSVREDPVVERNVGRILREIERLNALSAALLDYGRLAPPRLSRGEPELLWDEVIATHRGLLESKALALRSPPPTHVKLDFDAQQLAEVFGGALSNAVEAAPQGSDLELRSTVAAGRWQSSLHNLGPAVPTHVLPRVFDLFFSTKPGRMGMGLSMAQRIVEVHGGVIALENAPEGGVTLCITLPVP